MNINSVKNAFSPIFWENVNNRIDQFSDDLMESKVLPALKAGYRQMGQSIASLAGRIEPKWKVAFSQFWEAPISLPFAIKVMKVAETALGSLAMRKPTEIKGLEYLDKTIISTAQQLYPFTKEILYFLTLPQRLKDYASYFTFDAFFLKLEHFFGKAWTIIVSLVICLKELILNILDDFIYMVDSVFRFVLQNDQIQLLGYLKDIIKESKENSHRRFTERAHKAIDRRAEKLRKATNIKIGEASVDYLVPTIGRLGFKTAAIATLFALATYPIIQVPAAVALSPVLWKNGIKPLLEPYYQSYDPQYKLEDSYLREFCKKFPTVEKYFWELKTVKKLT